MDEIDYETYDIDEYIYDHGRYNMDENLFHEWKLKKLTTWMMWMKIMNIAEFKPHGEQYMVGFIAVIMHD